MERRKNAKRIRSEENPSELSSPAVTSPKDEVKLEKKSKNESSRPKRETKLKFAIEAKPEKKDKSFKRKSKRIVCTLCPKNKCFTTLKTYHQHVRRVHQQEGQKKIIVCYICSAKLKSEVYFKRHMETRHSKTEKIYSCDYCGRTFNQKDYLRIHMDRHRIHQILTCTVCQKSYISKHTFRRHLKMHIEKHICSFCGLIFHQKMLLENHYATKHCDDLPFKCQYCTRLFASKTARNNHHYIAHKDSKTELKFKCDECNVYFEMKEELRIHSFIHFNGEILHCTECDQIFKTNRLLKIHMQKHETKKSFQCTQCGDYFTFKTGLAKHIRLNRCKGPNNAEGDEEFKLDEQKIAEIALGQLKDITKPKVEVDDKSMLQDEPLFQDESEISQSEDEESDVDFDLPEVKNCLDDEIEVEEFRFEDEVISKETRKIRKKKVLGLADIKSHKGRAHLIYTCDYCGDEIKYYKDIVMHLKTHTVNLRYKCKGENCHRAFKSRKKLVDHSLEVHGTKPKVVREDFACETCGRMFDNKSSYESHKLSHDDNARNHICSICSKRFKSIGNLRRHEATHTSTRNFQCDSCPKAFKTQLALKIHTEVVHAELKVFVHCGFCKAIVQEKHLNQHVKNQHTEEGQEKPFECSVCGKTFRTFKLGQRHFESVHEPKDRGIVYTCPQCPELQFYRQRDLKEHSFIHFDGTIFQCDECLKMFKNKRLLMIHRASHNGVGFPCKFCDNAVFKTRGGRRKHMLRLHGTTVVSGNKIEYQEATIEEEN